MLKQLRQKKTAKKILWGLAIIIIPAFTLFGAGSAIRNKKKITSAGKIFGKKVSFSEYDKSFFAARNQAILQYGDDILKIAQFLDFPQLAWNRIILLNETNRRRIKIPNKDVIAAIQNMPMFNRDGVFNQEIYEYIIRYLRTTARDFEENMRDSLKIAKLFENITADITIDEQELKNEYKKLHQEAQVEYISISPSDYKTQTTIKEKEIQNYYKENNKEFLRPDSVNIEYLGLEYPKDAEEQEKLNIQTQFTELTNKFKKPSDFNSIKEDSGLKLQETGFFYPEEPIPQIGWSSEFNHTAFSLTKEEISVPIQTAKGIYLLRLKDKKESYIPELNEVKNRIIEILTNKEAYIITKQKAGQFLSDIKEEYDNNPKAKLAQFARKLGLLAGETPLFKRNTYIERIGMSEEFSKTAFGLEKDKISDVIETPNALYIIKLIQFIDIDEEKFGQEKQDFRENLITQKKEEAFRGFLKELKNRANLISYIPKDYQIKYK